MKRNSNRLLNYYKGIIAEYLCMIRLIFSGHKIIKRRLKTPLGEIDFLTIRRGVRYVIEVKYRSSSIEAAKMSMLLSQERIYKAYCYLRRDGPVRFMYFAMSGFRSEMGEFEYHDKRYTT